MIKTEDEFVINVLQTANYEDNYSDDKVLVCETSINKNDCSDDYIEDDKIKQHEIITLNNNMKLSSSEQYKININSKIKLENQIVEANIKIEYDDELLFCYQCNKNYQDYCTTCRMLVHILDSNTFDRTHYKARKEMPKDILEKKETHGYFGIYALKTIPEGVKFGPFTGVIISECTWRLKEEKFIAHNNQSNISHWMQYVNFARNILEQNLLAFQCENNIYYRSTREIMEGEELLVYFGEEYNNGIKKDVDYTSVTEKYMEDVFACTFCCLGFNSKEHLMKHKRICLNGTYTKYSIEEITQCPFCKIYLVKQEYLEFHKKYCIDESSGEHPFPLLNDQNTILKQNRQQSKIDEYAQNEYKNNLEDDVKLKLYKCGICSKSFKWKRSLKAHVNKVHIDVEDIETHSYLKIHLTANHFKEGKYKCIDCGYETCISSEFKNHLLFHENMKALKSTECEFEKKCKSKLKHDDVKQFKCMGCKYETNIKSHLNRHMIEKHSEVKKYECSFCDFGTSCKSSLKCHLYTHEKIKRLQCTECEFKTNKPSNLTRHVKTLHYKMKKYNCSMCEFKTNYEPYLKSHINAKHCEERKFKCWKCEFETSYKSSLTYHIDWHDKVKQFKCPECSYETSSKSHLNRHVNAKHCKIKKFRCSHCNYQTSHKSCFKAHLDKHENLNKGCEY